MREGRRGLPLLNCKETVFKVETFENTEVKRGHIAEITTEIALRIREEGHCYVWDLMCLIMGSN